MRRALPIVMVLFVWTMTTHGKFSDSGDEPHYLMVAESLWSDHDLDLANNYANHDGRWFGADDLEHGPHARTTRQGALWSTHDIGVPLAILPVYVVATRLAGHAPEGVLARVRQTRGLFAYSIISLALTAATSWAMWLLMGAWTRETTVSRAFVLGLIVALSPPILSHAFLVFPETIAVLVTSAVAWALAQSSDRLTSRHVLIVVAAVGLMPWLHRKYAFLVFGLLFALFVQHRAWFTRKTMHVWTAVLVLGLGPQLVLHAWTWWAWGQLGGPQMLTGLPFSVSGLGTGALGLLFDRERGLVAYAPVYLLIPACWALGWRTSRVMIVPIASLFLPMAAFVVWSAGFSPAGRYLVPLVPLLVMPAVRAINVRALRLAAVPFIALQIVISAYLWQHPRALWPKDLGGNEVLAAIPVVGPLYSAALPSLATGDPTWRGWSVLAVIVALGLAMRALSSRPGHHREAREGREGTSR